MRTARVFAVENSKLCPSQEDTRGEHHSRLRRERDLANHDVWIQNPLILRPSAGANQLTWRSLFQRRILRLTASRQLSRGDLTRTHQFQLHKHRFFFCGKLNRTVSRVKIVQRITIDLTTRACIPSQPRGRTGHSCRLPSRLSNKDKTKAFPAPQQKMFRHLRSQDVRNSGGFERC